MIEINLVPDVKQQLIKAQLQRTMVIAIAATTALVSVGIVVLLAMYAFGVQVFMESSADGAIKDKFGELQSVQDLDKALTLQSQLAGVSDSHANVPVVSRFAEIQATITPKDDSINITKFAIDRENQQILIEGEASEGYKQLEIFKKTILASTFVYKTIDSNEVTKSFLTEQIIDGTRSFTEEEDGKRILRFDLSFEYPEELFSRDSLEWKMEPIKSENVTDSATDVPSSVLRNGEDQ